MVGLDILQQILELQAKLNSFWLDELNIFFATAILALAVLIGTMKEAGNRNDKAARIMVFTLLVGSVIGLVINFSIRDSVEKEIVLLEKEYFASIKDETIKMEASVIVHSEQVEKQYCPHINFKFKGSDQKCWFVKIQSDEKVTQLFVHNDSIDSKEGKKFVHASYYDLPNTDRELLNEYLELDAPHTKATLDVDINNWSFGF